MSEDIKNKLVELAREAQAELAKSPDRRRG